MKNILIAYPDAQGRGPSEVLSGPEESVTDTNRAMADIKSGRAPEGINCVELWSSERGIINRWVRHVPETASKHKPEADSKSKPKK